MKKFIKFRPVESIEDADKNPGGDELHTHTESESLILHSYEDYIPSQLETSVTRKLTNLLKGFYHSPEGEFPLTEYYFHIDEMWIEIYDRFGAYLLRAGIDSFTLDEIDWIKKNLPMYNTGEQLQDKSNIHLDFCELRNEGWMVFRRSGTYNQLIGFIREILPYLNISTFTPVNTHRDLSVFTHMHLGNFTYKQLAGADLTTWEVQDDLKYYFDDREDFCMVTREERQIINAFIDSKRDIVAVEYVITDYTNLKMFIGDKQPITITVYPLKASDKRTQMVTSDDSVAALDGTTIVAKDEGFATVTVSSIPYPDIKSEIEIEVIEADHLINTEFDIVKPEESIYDFNEEYIIGMGVNEPIYDLVNSFTNRSSNISVLGLDGEIIQPENWYLPVGTGMQIVFTVHGTEYERLRVIVRGDMDGNGYPDSKEIQAIRDHVNNDAKLTGYKYIALDVTQDGEVNLHDLDEIEDFIRGIIIDLNKA